MFLLSLLRIAVLTDYVFIDVAGLKRLLFC